MQRQKKKLTRQLIPLWIICSIFSGCGIPRPDSDLCVVNAPGQYQICYNLKRDYDSKGRRKPDAKPFFKPAHTIEDLNKNISMDPDSFARLKAYVNKLKSACE